MTFRIPAKVLIGPTHVVITLFITFTTKKQRRHMIKRVMSHDDDNESKL